jgi:hypothetical protein
MTRLPAHANPFRTACSDALAFRFVPGDDSDDWDALAQRFVATGHRGVLVGPHGSGKTTLREQFEARLRAAGWRVHLVVPGVHGPDAAQLAAARAAADAGAIISIDGLDRLGTWTWWRWQRALRGAGGILATSHVAGRLPLLRRHRTSAALLVALAQELSGDSDADLAPTCHALFAAHGGDLRACLRQLYDRAAGDGLMRRTAQATASRR